MFEPKKNIRRSSYINQIEETYQDHPCMQRVKALKEQLKQEKLQDKAFYQSIKPERPIRK